MSEANIPDQICTLRIELRDSKPLIWREVEVPTAITLLMLHKIVQAAMGWDDSHLWQLTAGGVTYGSRIESLWDEEEQNRDPAKRRLRDVLGPRRTTLEYEYDFGDSWDHRLIFTKIRAGDPAIDYPRYIGGEQCAPPEDCGGISGFYETLDVLKNPEHPEHEGMREWYDDYDPDVIDIERITVHLGVVVRAIKAAKKRQAKRPKP